ncbi:hypothetical protein PL11_001540 [Lentilactobacillus curieae]|uniref:Uncharacterized protein n=1 Tax=Lentilactobacillus curieae TaxID=1138822 RepID=A0A1S6QGG4_9LACO|nr:hypothetical protein [Lentilactobacillus curieae]AQW20689.1 hypothetical protein PL11_001540 [Lentilactobacillus curieae]
MKSAVVLVARYIFYLVGAVIALGLVMLFQGTLTFEPFKVIVSGSVVYFIINTFLIPIYRILNPKKINPDETRFESYKDRAMNLHHQDRQMQHRNNQWSANGVTANQWEYSWDTTQSYSGLADMGYRWGVGLLINALFILFSPVFIAYLVVILRSSNVMQ